MQTKEYKKTVSFSLSEDAHKALDTLAAATGLKRSTIVERGIEQAAKRWRAGQWIFAETTNAQGE